MGRRYYSKRHYDRVTNTGAGNPQLSAVEKIQVWRNLMAQFPGDAAVRETCEKLIREVDGQ